ncbi:MAG: DUF4430 domain-containing protein [Candidatus Kerfeldbacteria bacterium]|nr:DUF4430 domain-containing protein [Candidatus Kerfeldbacteria bacterium]
MRKFFIFVLSLALILPPVVVRADAASAVTYLKAQTQDEWITMALKASGETNVVKTHLQTFSGTLATDYAKRILAIVAVGENPATFAGTDLVAGLKALAQAGQIGEPGLLNDDAWGLMALRSAGVAESDTVVAGAKAYLLAHQGTDGGWGYGLTSGSDTNDTAAVLMALGEVSVTSGTVVDSALSYLRSAQNADGGFAYVPGSDSDSGSTSWVWSALQKLGQAATSWTKGSNTPAIFLQTLQLQDGSYKWQASDSQGSVSMTAFAVVALSNKYYPVKPASGASGATVSFRIEGSTSTICQGQITTPNALQLIKDAALSCGYTYNIQQLSFGPYLDRINTDQAVGMSGWLYLVNYKQASVGAADYQLQTGDEVLWYFGEYTWQPLRLSLSNRQAQAGETVTATVESSTDGVAWQKVSGASIKGAGSSLTTDSQGQVTITVSSSLVLWAEGTGYVRSERLGVQVGSADSQSVALEVTIDNPVTLPGGSSASFTVSSAQLALGSLQPGQAVEKQVTLTNTSTTPLHFEASVSGDSVFTDNLQLNRLAWHSWQANISTSANLPVAVRIPVPSSYSGSGRKTGTLIFWAAPVSQ